MLKMIAAAAALAVTPIAASAVPMYIGDDRAPTENFVGIGDSFGFTIITMDAGESGSDKWIYTNNSGVDVKFDFAFTVNRPTDYDSMTTPLDISYTVNGNPSVSVAVPMTSSTFSASFLETIMAGDSLHVDIDFERITEDSARFINFSAEVAPIPLPAAGWMLLSALAGVGFLARKRRAA